MREDIVGVMKNAIARGATPQNAAKSLINSGYPKTEVEEALNYVTSGAINTLTPTQNKPDAKNLNNKLSTLSSQKSNLKTLPVSKPQPVYKPKKETKGRGKTIFLFAVFILLVGALVATILFKDEIIGLFG